MSAKADTSNESNSKKKNFSDIIKIDTGQFSVSLIFSDKVIFI
jgi:hypothetical protein